MTIKSAYLLLFAVVWVAVARNINHDVTYEDVLQSTNDPNVLLVDVRRADEIAKTGIIPSAINIPIADFRDELSNTPNESFWKKYQREKPNLESQIVIYCTVGVRAQTALDVALELGYKNAKRFPGSWKEWAKKQTEDAAPAKTL